MTLEQIRNSEKTMLTAADVAPVIGCDPHWIRWTAKNNPKALGFPIIVVKTRVKIPRLPFLRHIGADPNEKEQRTARTQYAAAETLP